jgi:hypothetical protein
MDSILKRVKGAIKDYLERMAEANRKEFGNNTLDCCKLNKRPLEKKKK